MCIDKTVAWKLFWSYIEGLFWCFVDVYATQKKKTIHFTKYTLSWRTLSKTHHTNKARVNADYKNLQTLVSATVCGLLGGKR